MIVIRHETSGPHVRMRVFVGQEGQTRALAGTLAMREEEFTELQRLAAGDRTVKIVFLPERGEVSDVG